MYSKTNKVLSLAMSAAILLTNIMTPMKVFADEVNEPALDLERELLLETEPASYYLTLPYIEAVVYSVDETHTVRKDGQKEKDILLAYHEEDRVEFAFQPAETVQVKEIHLRDSRKNEYPFSIDENRKVSFYMPTKDLELTLVLEDIPIPEPVMETEWAEPQTPVVESEGTLEPTENREEGINEFDLTAQEVAGGASVYTPEAYEADDTQIIGTENDISDHKEEDEMSTGADLEPAAGEGIPQGRNENSETSVDEGEDAGTGTDEAAGAVSSDEGWNEHAESHPETPGVVLTAETEEDGLPAQGNILTAETLVIPLMSVDF